MLDQIIREQKLARAQTEAGQADKDTLRKAQEKVTSATKDLSKAMSKGKDGKEAKDGENKGDGKSKGDNKGESKKGDGKGKGKDKEGSPGQPQPNSDKNQSGKDTPGKDDVNEAIKKQKRAE